jgi:uncharacterized metal-binding protein
MIRLLVAAAIVMPCLGCASVTRGTTENISIATTPAGATAEISGLEIPTACVGKAAIAKTASGAAAELERFRAKVCPGLDPGWIPVRVKKKRQNKNPEPRSDSIGTEKAVGETG